MPFENTSPVFESHSMKIHEQMRWVVITEERVNGSLCFGSDFPSFLVNSKVNRSYYICYDIFFASNGTLCELAVTHMIFGFGTERNV